MIKRVLQQTLVSESIINVVPSTCYYYSNSQQTCRFPYCLVSLIDPLASSSRPIFSYPDASGRILIVFKWWRREQDTQISSRVDATWRALDSLPPPPAAFHEKDTVLGVSHYFGESWAVFCPDWWKFYVVYTDTLLYWNTDEPSHLMVIAADVMHAAGPYLDNPFLFTPHDNELATSSNPNHPITFHQWPLSNIDQPFTTFSSQCKVWRTTPDKS